MQKIHKILRPTFHFAKSCRFSTQAPLDTPPIFEAKHTFGQGGTLNTSIKNINLDIHFKTIWEDYAALKLYSPITDLSKYLSFSENERNCYLEDSQLPSSLQNQGDNLLVAEIPEYYSLNLVNRGSAGFVKAEVSSKLCGNVKLQLLNEKSRFFASKIKSEFFEADIKNGALEISTFLEAADFSLRSQAITTTIKRLGISRSATIDIVKGDFDIGSIYTGTFTPRGWKQEDLSAKAIVISNEMQTAKEIRQSLEKLIEGGNFIKVYAKNLKTHVGHWQGSSIIDVREANLNFVNYEGDRFVINAESGNINLSISRLSSEGLISMKSGTLKLDLEKNMKVNVFSYREKKFLGGEFVQGQPILLLDLGENVNLNIERTERKSIFERFAQKKAAQE